MNTFLGRNLQEEKSFFFFWKLPGLRLLILKLQSQRCL
jgi:hypothetical protein